MIKHLPERLQASIDSMSLNYPSLKFNGGGMLIGKKAFWEGWLQPISNPDNVDLILDDIDNGNLVQIHEGRVMHLPDCQRKHQSDLRFRKLKKPDQAFKVKIFYDGSQIHPRAFIIDPVVPKNKQKHMFGDSAICSYPPQKNKWHWKTNTVSDFTDQVLIWLIKWNVWNQTDYWLGNETSHNKINLYSSINEDDQCHCGSGEVYSRCHRFIDAQAIKRSIYEIVDKIQFIKQIYRNTLFTNRIF